MSRGVRPRGLHGQAARPRGPPHGPPHGNEGKAANAAPAHSKKRNRLGQSKVQRLVRTHSNLRLETSLKGWKANVLPWEIDMEIEERDSGEDSEESED